MKTSDFKELKVWQKAIELCKQVYMVVRKLPKEETYALSDQMRRAVISVPSNIAEGHGRESINEFLHFLAISRGSLCELETQLIVSVEIGLLRQEDIAPSLSLCAEISKKIKSLANYLSSKKQQSIN